MHKMYQSEIKQNSEVGVGGGGEGGVSGCGGGAGWSK